MMRAFAKATGQLPRYRLANVLGTVSLTSIFAIIVIGIVFRSAGPDLWDSLLAVMFIVCHPMLFASLWLLRTIRCPQCRKRVFWYLFTHHDAHPTYIRRSSKTDPVCPACGFEPGKDAIDSQDSGSTPAA